MSDKTPKEYSYDEARALVESESVGKRLDLAGNPSTPPEILYFLANDESAKVRMAVARNRSTPVLADQSLAEDPSEEVRGEIAHKVSRLVPTLSDEGTEKLRDRVFTILATLAADQLPHVRQILADELKNSADAPHGVIKTLAGDDVIEVSIPVLEYSPLLSDTDLQEIIAAGIAQEALAAIARRGYVSETLADTIANTLEIPAVAALLANKDARIRNDTLEQIVEEARKIEPWHEPLATRPNLSIRLIRRVAGFVASSLVNKMVENNDLPESFAKDLKARARARIDSAKMVDDAEDEIDYQARAVEFLRRGMLDDDFIIDQIDNKNRILLKHCLAVMADVPLEVVDKVLMSRDGNAITALGFKAGLKMRTAYDIQVRIAMVPRDKLVLARNGFEYPSTPKDMQMALSYFEN